MMEPLWALVSLVKEASHHLTGFGEEVTEMYVQTGDTLLHRVSIQPVTADVAWYHYYYLYSSTRHSKGISSLSNWLFPPLCSN